MDIDHERTAISEILFRFTGDSLILQERITFTVDFELPPCHLKKFMEFLVVDTYSTYHGVLGKPVLQKFVGDSIHHLAIKFLTLGGVAKIRGNQIEAKSCYMNALHKVANCEETSRSNDGQNRADGYRS
ncbi:Uncharacterized protein Adt_11898 [Abeliophyllum distichum]|uniref:Uncharacterized protein n=1 Tax=Abeliophyllum distichum TaxID=126358 RepID=A0ABD1UP63_9LAMI